MVNSSDSHLTFQGIPKVFQGIQMQQQQQTATPQADAFRITRRRIRPAVFCGSLREGEEMQQKRKAFQEQINDIG